MRFHFSSSSTWEIIEDIELEEEWSTTLWYQTKFKVSTSSVQYSPYCMNLAKKTRGMIGHKERQRNGVVFRLHRTLGSVTVTVCKTGLLHGSRKTLGMGRQWIVILRHTVSLCVLKNGKISVKKSYFCCLWWRFW